MLVLTELQKKLMVQASLMLAVVGLPWSELIYALS
jgi:hypothetical protein